MRSRIILFTSAFVVCLVVPAQVGAQTQGFQAGMTVGARSGCALRTDCGPGFAMGWFFNGDHSSRPLPIDAQAEVLMGAQGTTERQGFARAALLLRMKSIVDDDDPSPRLHVLIGPQVEFRSTSQLAGVGGRPDLRLALGADIVQRHAIVELRYTAHVGVRHDTQPAIAAASRSPGAYGTSPSAPTVVSAPRSSLMFRDGAVVLTVGVRVGGL